MKANSKDTIPASIINRKGARSAGEILPEVVELLNSGEIESVNLTEWLAVDHLKLLRVILTEFELSQHTEEIISIVEQQKNHSTMKVIPVIAGELLRIIQEQPIQNQEALFARFATHLSDTVRCWATYIVGLDKLDLEQYLSAIRPFAADHHFGVREIAWMAVRDAISEQLQPAIRLLSSWVHEPDANLRRFAVESTRPRGVWTKHITQLKETPEWGLPLLEPLTADSSKYVQDSVANWLNDAAKTQPNWVTQVCDTWLAASNSKETKRITTRATRSIK